MSARSSASFMRRTARGSSTPKQRAYLRSLVSSRDLSTCAYPVMVRELSEIAADPDRWLPELSIDGAASYIDAALSCAERAS